MEDYAEAIKVLNGRKSRKVANNTWIEINPSNGEVAIRLHHTHVVTFKMDGSIILKTGGWRTVTTKDRMNTYTPQRFQIYSDKNVWYVVKGRHTSDTIRVEFYDGMDLNSL